MRAEGAAAGARRRVVPRSRPARTLAVVGESGCGKSTLARQVTMIETPTAGALDLDGADVAHADAAAEAGCCGAQVQMVFQNPYASLNPRKKIGQALEEPLAINTHADVRPNARERSARDAGAGRPAARAPRALPAHVLGRPAPAHRDRARADAAAEGRRRRRAGLGARRVDPGPGAEPADGPAGGDRRRLRLHFAQPRGGRADRRRGAGDVPRQGGRARAEGPPVRARRAIRTRARCSPARRASTSRRAAQRQVLSGELPSPLAPPSGCVFRTRCPHAQPRCADEVPLLENVGGDQWVACLRKDEIG